ncbi:MAG: endonuclease NucS domain-containing protein [Patescibacteria group bacterium]
MEKEEIIRNFQAFLEDYNEEENRNLWIRQSQKFKDFWNNRIMANGGELTDDEIDAIVLILDSKAKGKASHPEINPVAMMMTPQGAWRNLFREIKSNREMKDILDYIFKAKGEDIIALINRLYYINKGNKNRLTGDSANVINGLIFAYNPSEYVSAVSLNDREQIINYFGFSGAPDFKNDEPGEKVFKSNESIKNGFKSIGIDADPRTISNFLYSIKSTWKGVLASIIEEMAESDESEDLPEEKKEEKAKVLEEAIYQKLIHRNFETLFKGLKYYKPEYQNKHDGHFITYGKDETDFLAADKDGNFVVIEIKVSGDDRALAQIQRYMGWVKEELCQDNEKSVRGIIISENEDVRLNYALKVAKDIEFKKMKLDINII